VASSRRRPRIPQIEMNFNEGSASDLLKVVELCEEGNAYA
jgi:hypothetical protein